MINVYLEICHIIDIVQKYNRQYAINVIMDILLINMVIVLKQYKIVYNMIVNIVYNVKIIINQVIDYVKDKIHNVQLKI